MHRRRPWLVLIQGMGFDRAGWEPVQRKLRRHFRLVLADNRGCGRSDRPAGRIVCRSRHGRRYRRRARCCWHPQGPRAGGEPGRDGGPGTGGYPPRAGRRSRPCLHDTGLALRLPHARCLGPADPGDRRPDGRGGAAPPHGECPVCAHRPGPSRTRRSPSRAAGLPASGPASPVGPGGGGSAVCRALAASAHPGAHAGPAWRCGYRGRPAERQAARGPDPGRSARDLP